MPQATPSRTMYAGVILFATGIVFVLIDVMPFLFGAHDRRSGSIWPASPHRPALLSR